MELLTAEDMLSAKGNGDLLPFAVFLAAGYRTREICYEPENTCISSCITVAALEKLSKMSDEEFEKLELYLAFDV